jgi:fatty-acyl-CoA synthase
MQGLMQRQPLLLSAVIRHAARHHPAGEVVSKLLDGSVHRTNYREIERRSRCLARALQALDIHVGDRVATLAWNSYRHLELYYAVSGSGVVCHTVNPRLATDDIAYIINHAADVVLFAEASFADLVRQIAPAIAASVRAVVFLTNEAGMPEVMLPAGMDALCYETLMAQADESFVWPEFDENTASVLCYTSGTTGRPRGVLYTHRSCVLHAMMACSPDIFSARAIDRMLLGTSMYHATSWGLPYVATMVGAALILPGRWLDPANVHSLLEAERATFTAGVPTIWLGLLQHLKATGARLTTLQRIVVAGSACPPLLIDAFGAWGIDVRHLWGMTETSPVVACNAPLPATAGRDAEATTRVKLRQGRCIFGADLKIVDAEDRELPWDGVAFGDLKVRGPWITQEYLHLGKVGAADAEGWFATGDIATIDADGFMEVVDRTKDVIKSGGEWISSIVLENIAVLHPHVAEAAAIAVPHPKWIERPLLLVVPRDGTQLAVADVLALFEGKIARWWIPDGVVFVDALPHTATGKLNKLALRQAYATHYGVTPG